MGNSQALPGYFNKNVHFREMKDPYLNMPKSKKIKPNEPIHIDSKFLSDSDDDSPVEPIPAKRIKLHQTNIFSKIKLSPKPTEQKLREDESAFKLN